MSCCRCSLFSPRLRQHQLLEIPRVTMHNRSFIMLCLPIIIQVPKCLAGTDCAWEVSVACICICLCRHRRRADFPRESNSLTMSSVDNVSSAHVWCRLTNTQWCEDVEWSLWNHLRCHDSPLSRMSSSGFRFTPLFHNPQIHTHLISDKSSYCSVSRDCAAATA